MIKECLNAGPVLRKLASVLLAMLVLAGSTSWAAAEGGKTRVFCKRVIDGDTIVLSDGRHVRYLEINAPEIRHGYKPGEPYGREATSLNKKLVEGKPIDIIVARQETHDQYDRLIAHVFTVDGRLVSEILLGKGLAHCCFYQRPDSYARRLLDAQRSAIMAGRGIWSIRHHDLESYYIGNIRSLKFHRPGCPFGRQTSPRNRVIFHTRKEAFLKGYCPCKRCQP